MNPIFSYSWEQYREYCLLFNAQEIIEASKKAFGKIKCIPQNSVEPSKQIGCFLHKETYKYSQKEMMLNRGYTLMAFYGVKHAYYTRNDSEYTLYLYIPLDLADNHIIKRFYGLSRRN